MMVNIPYVSNADIDRWAGAIDRMLPVLISMINEGKTQQGRRIYQLYREYRSQAALKYCLDDLDGCREAIVNSVNAYKLLLSSFKKGESIDPGLISCVDYQAMLMSLIVDDAKLAKEVADLYETLFTNSSDSIFFVELGLAIKCSILGQLNEAKVHIINAEKNSFEYVREFARFAKESILSESEEGLDFLWNAALSEFDSYIKSESRGTPEAVIFFDGLGFLALHARLYNKKLFKPRNTDARANFELLSNY